MSLNSLTSSKIEEPIFNHMEITEEDAKKLQEKIKCFDGSILATINKFANKFVKLDEKEDIEQIKRDCVEGTDFHMISKNTLLNVILDKIIKFGRDRQYYNNYVPFQPHNHHGPFGDIQNGQFGMPMNRAVNLPQPPVEPVVVNITDTDFVKQYLRNRSNVKDLEMYLNNKDKNESTELHKICKLSNLNLNILELVNPIRFSKLYFIKDINGNSPFTNLRDNPPKNTYDNRNDKNIFDKIITYNIEELSIIYNFNKYYPHIIFGLMSIGLLQFINMFGIYHIMHIIPIIVSVVVTSDKHPTVIAFEKLSQVTILCGILTIIDYSMYDLHTYVNSAYLVQSIFIVGLIISLLLFYIIIFSIIMPIIQKINKKTIINKLSNWLY